MLSDLLARPEVDRITYLHLEFVGPGRLYLVAAVDMAGDDVEHDLAVRLRRVERELEQHDNIEEAVLTLATPDEPSLADACRRCQQARPRLRSQQLGRLVHVVDAGDDPPIGRPAPSRCSSGHAG